MKNEFDFNESQILISADRDTVGIVLPNGCTTSGLCIGRVNEEGYITMNAKQAKRLIRVLQEFVDYHNSMSN